MISHENKFIFVHINKCAGHSIEEVLRKFGGFYMFSRKQSKTRRRHHIMARQYSKTEYWSEYFKFSIVRNPWDKECSDFHYHNKLRQQKNQPLIESFKHYFQLREHKLNRLSFWHSNQLGWLYSDNKKMEMNFVGRFENLQEDFNTIFDKIGIPRQELPQKNKTKHKHYTEYYDDETKQIVAEKYAKDIEYFGYKFGE